MRFTRKLHTSLIYSLYSLMLRLTKAPGSLSLGRYAASGAEAALILLLRLRIRDGSGENVKSRFPSLPVWMALFAVFDNGFSSLEAFYRHVKDRSRRKYELVAKRRDELRLSGGCLPYKKDGNDCDFCVNRQQCNLLTEARGIDPFGHDPIPEAL